jgi:hypothetical protein
MLALVIIYIIDGVFYILLKLSVSFIEEERRRKKGSSVIHEFQ